MKKGWEIKTLADVCAFENGDRGVNYPSKAKRSSTGIPFINAGHFVDNEIDFTNMDYISRERYNLMGSGKIQKGDILFCLRGSLGKFASVDNLREGQIASSLVIVRPSKLVLHEYLLAYFESYLCEENIERFRGGTAQPNLSAKSLTQFAIPIPPLPEQQRIVSVLDEAFASIAQAKSNAERNLVNARELFESYLESLFANSRKGWEEKKLGEVCERITDGTHVTPKYVPKGVPFLSVKNLTKGFIDFSDTRFITPEEHKLLTKRVRPEREDVLYTKVGTTGIAKVVDVDVEFSIFVSVALLKIKHEIIFNKYLEFFLNSPFARKQAQKRTRGMANRNLVINDIKEIEIHFPKSIAEQHVIVGRLEALSAETGRLEEIYQSKLEALEELKRSVLAKAFAGLL